jgi:hypothetical protein
MIKTIAFKTFYKYSSQGEKHEKAIAVLLLLAVVSFGVYAQGKPHGQR